MIQKTKQQGFNFDVLNNSLIRWVLVIAACMIWSMFTVALSGPVASFIAFFATVFFIYVGGNYYTLSLLQNRDKHNPHQRTLMQMGGYLLAAFFLSVLGWIGILIAMGAAAAIFKSMVQGPVGKTATEGRYIEQDARRMAIAADKMRPDDDTGIMLGGVRLPTVSFTTNTAIVGTVGSGKSVTMGLIAREVLPKIGSIDSDKRALIYDASKSWVGTLEQLGIPHIITNPFDSRCRPWDIAKDIVTDADAMALAEILVPKPEGLKDPYWIEITQICVSAVVRYFNTSAPGNWTFRDLVIGLRDQALIIKMCQDDPQLLHYSKATGSENTAANIYSSLITNMQKYELVAALWHKAETELGNKPFSLEEDWLFSSSVLLLGRSTTSELPLQALNNILFKRIGQLMMEELPEVDEPNTWIFLDELGSLGKLDFLKIAATELRKYGGALVVGFQSITQLRDNFNDKVTNTILGQFDQVAGLRLSDEPTETWLRGVFGRVRFKEKQISESSSKEGGKNLTVSYRRGEEDVLLKGEMNSIPPFKPKLKTNMRGLYMWGAERWWSEYPYEVVNHLLPRGDKARNFVRMPKNNQRLVLWTEDDWQRLNITHLMTGEAISLPEPNPNINIVQMDDDTELDALLGENNIQDYLPVAKDALELNSDDKSKPVSGDATEDQQRINAQYLKDKYLGNSDLTETNYPEDESLSVESIMAGQQDLQAELHSLLSGSSANAPTPLSQEAVQSIVEQFNGKIFDSMVDHRQEQIKRPLTNDERQRLENMSQIMVVKSLSGDMYSEEQVLHQLRQLSQLRMKNFQKTLENNTRENHG